MISPARWRPLPQGPPLIYIDFLSPSATTTGCCLSETIYSIRGGYGNTIYRGFDVKMNIFAKHGKNN